MHCRFRLLQSQQLELPVIPKAKGVRAVCSNNERFQQQVQQLVSAHLLACLLAFPQKIARTKRYGGKEKKKTHVCLAPKEQPKPVTLSTFPCFDYFTSDDLPLVLYN